MKRTAAVLIALALLMSACVAVEERPGPHPLPPPHRCKARHIYYYYPSAFVYFDVNRRLYFFLSNGAWVAAPVLPPTIVIRPDRFVTIELDVDRPYIYFEKHRKKFPPGKKYRRHRGRHGMH
ncbi:MAG: hypothetical protein GXO94_04250 [Nitrospirae bacterium]|nr:hypothetical protein [Nitrospirota bacterium]